MEVLKHVSTIDFRTPQNAGIHSLPYRMSFHGDYLYVCVDGVIKIYNWRVDRGRYRGRVTPELGDHWRLYPVYRGRIRGPFLAAMDCETIYVFDVTHPEYPYLERIFVPYDDVGGDLPAATFPWTNMHICDDMVIGHRSMLAHFDPSIFGHAFYFWSIFDGTLIRKLSFNQADFPTVSLYAFFQSSIKFIANRAFLAYGERLLYV